MAKIMIIDDDSDIRVIEKGFLENEGHTVILVTDGVFGMDEIRKNKPDLIILDIMMPGLDGCALGYHIKFQSEFKHIPILIVSAIKDMPYIAKDIAAEYFMEKPFKGAQLVAKVQEILDRKSVKVGIVPTGRTYTRSKMRKIQTMGKSALLALVASVILFTVSITSFEFLQESPDVANRAVSVMADRVFLYSIPLAMVLLSYISYTLTKYLQKPVREGI